MTLFEGLAHLGRYSIISADPPWEHDNFGQAKHGAAKANYEEMPLEDLCRMPVGDLAHPDGALLFLWCTGPQAADGAHLELARAWGFRLTTRAFAWVKTNRACAACGHDVEEHDAGGSPDVGQRAGGFCTRARCGCEALAVSADFGPGSYTGGNVEDVWLGVREGNGRRTWSKDRARRDVRQVIFAPAAERHSAKPEAMQDRVDALWPDPSAARLELFARRRRTGLLPWACWGGQCPEPDLVFGADVGAWWPVTRPAGVQGATPAEVSMFGGAP